MKTLSVSLALMFGACLLAQPGMASAASVVGTVYNWQLYADGSFSFVLNGAPHLCANGNGSNQRGAVVAGVRGMTADGVKAMYSTIVSASLAGKQVTVYTDENVLTSGWGCSVYALEMIGA